MSKDKNKKSMKQIKINIPVGYEIDKENSTFECIKFKPKSKVYWSDEYHTVVVEYADESFVVHPYPTMIMNFNEANKFVDNFNIHYKLPTVGQLFAISTLLGDINKALYSHNMFPLQTEISYWSNEEVADMSAFCVYIGDGKEDWQSRTDLAAVRLVSEL